MSDTPIKKNLDALKKTAVSVITNPAGFFRDMPVGGGYADPLIFTVAMGVLAGIVMTLFSLIGLVHADTFMMALATVVFMPIFTGLASFIGAAILFVIWKLMGSQCSYETAFRCGAYASAIFPITTLISVIPYVGAMVGLLWMMYLTVIASTEVHKIAIRKAWIVFGILFAVMIFLNINTQIAARKARKEIEKWGVPIERMNEMTPEEAGKAFGEFMKGVEEGSRK
jgi:hypothetical protein